MAEMSAGPCLKPDANKDRPTMAMLTATVYHHTNIRTVSSAIRVRMRHS